MVREEEPCGKGHTDTLTQRNEESRNPASAREPTQTAMKRTPTMAFPTAAPIKVLLVWFVAPQTRSPLLKMITAAAATMATTPWMITPMKVTAPGRRGVVLSF